MNSYPRILKKGFTCLAFSMHLMASVVGVCVDSYQAEMRRLDHSASPRTRIVPDLDWSDPEVTLLQRELPGEDVDPANIFCCRKVYDFRMKRILKNPS